MISVSITVDRIQEDGTVSTERRRLSAPDLNKLFAHAEMVLGTDFRTAVIRVTRSDT